MAKAMFAMASWVAGLLASLTLQQVRSIATSNAQELRVRWECDTEFWGELLSACRSGDEQAIESVRLQGKLLFAGPFPARRQTITPSHPSFGDLILRAYCASRR